MITDRDMREQITTIIGSEIYYDVNAIVDQIQKEYGTVDVNIIPSGALYDIIVNHFIDDEPDTSCHCGHSECGAC